MFQRLKNAYKLYKAAKDSRVNHLLTDKDRQESFAVKGLKKQLQTMEEINEKQEDLIKQLSKSVTLSKNTMEENLISMALPILLQKISGESKPQPIAQTQLTESINEVNLTDEQIRAILQSKPELKQYSKNFSDDEIETYLNTQIPNISKASKSAIIAQLKE